jgi:hypothetical protein
MSVRMSGLPMAAASMADRSNPSRQDARTNTSMSARRCGTSLLHPVKITSDDASDISERRIAFALARSTSPTKRKRTSGISRRISRATVKNSRHPFSTSRRPIEPTTCAAAGIPNSFRIFARRAVEIADGSNVDKSTPFPRNCARPDFAKRRRLAQARSSLLS